MSHAEDTGNISMALGFSCISILFDFSMLQTETKKLSQTVDSDFNGCRFDSVCDHFLFSQNHFQTSRRGVVFLVFSPDWGLFFRNFHPESAYNTL